MTKTDFRKIYPKLTQNINGVEVELNESEYEKLIAQWEINEAEQLKEQAEADAKAQAKAQLLAQLGITEEQAKLLLS